MNNRSKTVQYILFSPAYWKDKKKIDEHYLFFTHSIWVHCLLAEGGNPHREYCLCQIACIFNLLHNYPKQIKLLMCKFQALRHIMEDYLITHYNCHIFLYFPVLCLNNLLTIIHASSFILPVSVPTTFKHSSLSLS